MVNNIKGHIFIVFAGENYYRIDVPSELDTFSKEVYEERRLTCEKYITNLYIWIALRKYTDNVEIYSVREVDSRGHFHPLRIDFDFQYTKVDRYIYKKMLYNKESFAEFQAAFNIKK